MTTREVTPKHLTSSWPPRTEYPAPEDEPRSPDTQAAVDQWLTHDEDGGGQR